MAPLVSALGALLYGYDNIVINGAIHDLASQEGLGGR